MSAVLMAIAAFAWIVLKSGWRRTRGKLAVFWLFVALGSLAMMLPVSSKLWETVPALAALQFPWRFNITLTLAAAALTGMAAATSDIRQVKGSAILAAGIAALLLIWTAVDFKSVRAARPWKPEMRRLVAGDYLYPAWAKWTVPELLSVDGMANLNRQLEAGLASGQRYIQVAGSRSALFETQGTNEWLTLRRFFYPGLIARTSSGQEVELRPSPDTGLIDIKVPEGPQRIRLMLPWSGAEKTGFWLTILAALAVGYLCLRPDALATRAKP
jgi:hypothetical protein